MYKRNPSPQHVIDAMKTLRKALGLSQTEFSNIFFFGSSVAHYETGLDPWPEDVLRSAPKKVRKFLWKRYKEDRAAVMSFETIQTTP